VEGEGWVNAENLEVGDDVHNADGETGEVESITIEETTQEMYNLTVDTAHTFFVGGGQWLVHNACSPKSIKDEWTLVGYHGTTSEHIDSLLMGINPPTPGVNYGGWSQLGPGFYTTNDLTMAKTFADNAYFNPLFKGIDITDLVGEPVIVQVFAKNFEELSKITVPRKHWGTNFKPSLYTQYDYLTAPIKGYDKIQQIKFNPTAYRDLQIRIFEGTYYFKKFWK